MMKKITALIASVSLILSVSACDLKESSNKTEHLTLDCLVVDDSYESTDGSKKALYAFFTVNAGGENMEVDSKYMELTVNDANTYTSEIIPSAFCKFAPNYYYGGYIEHVYVGESKKLAATFLVPNGDLEKGKKIIFSDSQIPEISELTVSTNDIIHTDTDEEVCKIADPEGYAVIREKYNEASVEVAEQVKSLINDRYWEAYVNPMSYKVTFTAPNNFTVATRLGENGGTYSVRNGYIVCTYESNGGTVEIPYEIKEQGVEMDLGEAFRIN